MPTYAPQPPIDVANVASRFPEPLQKPGGMILSMLQQAAGGNDPASVMTTIGPNAIPLSEPDAYARKAVAGALEDLGGSLRDMLAKKKYLATPHAQRIFDAAISNPALINKIEATSDGGPLTAQYLMKHWAENKPEALDGLIQHLSDAYIRAIR